MNTAFEIAGVVTIVLVGVVAVLFAFGLGAVLVSRGRKKVVTPRLTLFCLKLFYSPISSLLGWVGLPFVADDVLTRAVNGMMAPRFKDAGPNRMIFLPQCLRGPSCKAPLDPRFGYVCNRCGGCSIAAIAEAAERNGYDLFIVPGDSFVKRIMKKQSPDAVIGIACHEELSMAMLWVARQGGVCSGVLLTKSGCYCTDVDVDEVIAIMDGETCCKSSEK